MRVRRMATAVTAVLVVGSLAVGCGSGGGKKRRSGGGSHSSSSGGSHSGGSYSGGSSSSGSTTGGSSSTRTPTPSPSTSAPGGEFYLADVTRAIEQTYDDVAACGVGKWTKDDRKTLAPAAHRNGITSVRSYDCYPSEADTKPTLPRVGTYLIFADEAKATAYVHSLKAVDGVVGVIVDDESVVTIGNPAGLKNPRAILDFLNTACNRCGTVTTM
ncbi:hypothetical protein [Streptomyces sp. SID3343]|uniref:hypothetical protein n=1 Tax=Streptomyces sp. SID3343 TaxID=2690260 RepID=UPI0013C0A8B8|nr:hypothetical protein [Streptomyces sp. SID3343]MYW03871.1 hypothetical protein [Streptomyces sp. SID3343]